MRLKLFLTYSSILHESKVLVPQLVKSDAQFSGQPLVKLHQNLIRKDRISCLFTNSWKPCFLPSCNMARWQFGRWESAEHTRGPATWQTTPWLTQNDRFWEAQTHRWQYPWSQSLTTGDESLKLLIYVCIFFNSSIYCELTAIEVLVNAPQLLVSENGLIFEPVVWFVK